jgi:hypothetical protein
VPRNDAKEALKTLTPGLDDLVGEAVGEDLAGERGDVHPRRLTLENIPKGLKVRITSTHERVSQFERGDIRLFQPFAGGTNQVSKKCAARMGMGHVRGTRLRNRCTSSVQILHNRPESVCARIETPLEQRARGPYRASGDSALQSPENSQGYYTSPRSVLGGYHSYEWRRLMTVGRTVCSRPASRVSSKPLRAKGDTAEAIDAVVVRVDEQAGV